MSASPQLLADGDEGALSLMAEIAVQLSREIDDRDCGCPSYAAIVCDEDGVTCGHCRRLL